MSGSRQLRHLVNLEERSRDPESASIAFRQLIRSPLRPPLRPPLRALCTRPFCQSQTRHSRTRTRQHQQTPRPEPKHIDVESIDEPSRHDWPHQRRQRRRRVHQPNPLALRRDPCGRNEGGDAGCRQSEDGPGTNTVEDGEGDGGRESAAEAPEGEGQEGGEKVGGCLDADGGAEVSGEEGATETADNAAAVHHDEEPEGTKALDAGGFTGAVLDVFDGADGVGLHPDGDEEGEGVETEEHEEEGEGEPAESDVSKC